MSKKNTNRVRRHKRVRSKVVGIANRPRLSIFRSNRFVYAQVIDDTKRQTLVGVHSRAVVTSKEKNATKGDIARLVGRELARRVLEKKIKQVTFDRGGYRYQGRVRVLAEGAREEGLEF